MCYFCQNTKHVLCNIIKTNYQISAKPTTDHIHPTITSNFGLKKVFVMAWILLVMQVEIHAKTLIKRWKLNVLLHMNSDEPTYLLLFQPTKTHQILTF